MRAEVAGGFHRTWRVDLPAYAGVLVVAALAWAATLTWIAPMGAGPGTMGLSLAAFLPVWVVMMAAMMLPSVAPTALVWIRSVGARPTRRARVVGVASFLSGYLLTWSAFGVLVFLALLEVDRLLASMPGVAPWVGAAVLALAGAYQLTPWKSACLRHCRTPVGAMFHYAGLTGRARDLRVGLHHGTYCVGCCWGLMALLVGLGAMNVPAMVALTGVVLAEKAWRHGPALSRVGGVVLLAGAPLVLLVPGLVPVLLPGLSPGAMSM
ncbi:MAG: hypothetical protein JWR42_2688 [Marmoricola sp.]|nr:hypothetical protein [Marmoricola sp.]